jgi:oligoribonuclease
MEKVIDNETGKTHYEPPFGIHETVVDMHTKNGLWDEVGITPFTVRAAEDILVAWILNASAEQLPLVGNTISFDRNFLRFHMPHLESLFHYRSLDISSIKIAANLWAPLSEADKPQQDKKHRVISDMYDSLRELEVYRAAYFIH